MCASHVDFNLFLKEYSEIIYPLFLWNMFFYRCNDMRTFPMKRFNENTALNIVNIKNPRQALAKLQHVVEVEVEYWKTRFPDYVPMVEEQKDKLKDLGLTPDNTYLFIQGHHLLDNVVMKLLIPVCTQLRREQEDRIRRKSAHQQQLANELTGYERSALPVEVVLRKNVEYKQLFLYRWILEDLYNIFP